MDDRRPYRLPLHLRALPLVLACLLLMPFTRARAADPIASISARMGYDGTLYLQTWMPVVVDVEALTRDIDGRVSVFVPGRSARPTEVYQDVTIAKGARKRVTLNIHPATVASTYRVRFMEGNVVVAEQELSKVPARLPAPLLGVLGDANALVALTGQKALPDLGLGELGVVKLTPDAFPTCDEQFEPFRAILVEDVDLTLLSAECQAALAEWVTQGGVLIASPGAQPRLVAEGINHILNTSLAAGTSDVQNLKPPMESATGIVLSDGAITLTPFEGAGEVGYTVGGLDSSITVSAGSEAPVASLVTTTPAKLESNATPEPIAAGNVAAAPKDDAAAPKDDAAAPKDDAAAPKDDAPAPKDDTPAPKDDAAAPKDDAPATKDDVAAPSVETTALPSIDSPSASNLGAPLLYRLPHGDGYVLTLAFSPGQKPLSGWKGTWPLLRAALNATLPAETKAVWAVPVGTTNRITPYSAIGALSNMESMKLPPMGWAFALVGAFLLLAGPVGYLVLKKLKKREWMWIMAPVVAVACSLAVYALGVGVRGRDSVVSSLAVVKLPTQRQQAMADVYRGVYIPKKGDYAFSIENAPLLRDAGEDTDYYFVDEDMRPRELPANTHLTGGTMRRDGLQMWTLSALSYRQPVEDVGGVTASLRVLNDNVVGTLRNDTGLPLTMGFLYLGNGGQYFDAIAPGESVEVSFGGLFEDNYGGGAYDALMKNLYSRSDLTQAQQRAIRQRFDVMQGLINTGGNQTRTEPRFLAWSDGVPLWPLSVNGAVAREAAQQALVMADLPIDLYAGGQLTTLPNQILFMPDGEIESQADPQTREKYGTMYGAGYALAQETTFTANVSAYARDFDITSARVWMGQLKDYPIDASIYNAQAGAWEPFSSPFQIASGSIAEYIAADGTVKLRLKPRDTQYGGIGLNGLPSLVIAGRERP